MAASRNPLLASLKKAFAVAHGCDERTARRHANKNSAEWQAFVAKTGMAAAEKITASEPASTTPPTDAEVGAIQVLSPASPSQVMPPPQASRADVELSEPERIVKMQWNIYVQASKSWQAAMKSQDMMAASAFGLSASKALDTYYRALARLEEWQVRMRRLVPFEEFQSLLPAMEGTFALLRAFPAELALEANPSNPALARDAGERWLAARFQPQADALLRKLEETTVIDNALAA